MVEANKRGRKRERMERETGREEDGKREGIMVRGDNDK